LATQRIVITGRPGTGKTTLVKRLLAYLPRADGFITEEIRDGKMRIGFKIIALNGEEGLLARKGFPSSCRLGSYGVNINDLEKVGVKALKRALAQKVTVVIDEIGKMELFSRKFRETVRIVLESDQDTIAVVQMSPLPFLRDILAKPGLCVYEVTRENREQLFSSIREKLKQPGQFENR